ncbi:uncharacterized protein JCM15063_006008 [Sporobolomyces koalae]|uniref:uncharacterized protein n=1 Tax=Sporobolomyces koalae TaxID=500713 RepID=UPI00316B7E4F
MLLSFDNSFSHSFIAIALSGLLLASSPANASTVSNDDSTPSRFHLARKSLAGSPLSAKIPLVQRGSYFAKIRQNDGVVDLSSLNSQISVAQNKMQSGAYKYFHRHHHRLPGFRVSATTEHFLDSVWQKVSNANDDRKLNLKRQQNPLTNYDDGSLWAGKISVGTPPQEVIACFDTGSADFWVADSSTNAGLDTYNVNKSSTAKPTDDRFGILYGDGSTVNGPLYQDTVSVAGLVVKDAYVAAATTLSPQFSGGPIDGILGLAYPAISNTGEKTVFQSMREQNLVKENLFSFELGDADEGELYLGGTDSSRYEGDIQYSPVTQFAYWTIEGSVGTAGKQSNPDQTMIIDTGTTLVIAPPSQAALLYANVPTAKKWKDSFYQYQCSVEWTAQFTFNGHVFTVPSKYLNLGRTEKGSDWCVSGIAAQDLGLGQNWLVGGVFLRTVYSVFNFEKNAVGFAPLKGKDYTVIPSSSSLISSSSSSLSASSSYFSSTPSITPSSISSYSSPAPTDSSTSTLDPSELSTSTTTVLSRSRALSTKKSRKTHSSNSASSTSQSRPSRSRGPRAATSAASPPASSSF